MKKAYFNKIFKEVIEKVYCLCYHSNNSEGHMGILEKFRKKKEVLSSERTSLVAKSETTITPIMKKKKKVRSLVDFVEYSLTSNGGNYEDIYKKLLAMSEFAKSAEEYGVDCNLARVDETLKDFFTKQDDIKFYPFKDVPYRAFYTKKDGWAFYNYRGVTVVQDEQAKMPVMYYGRRHEKAETHKKDTIFCFGDDIVVLRDELQAKYDEIPLYGDGTHAEFSFDKDNHITKVAFRKMTNGRLGFWSEEQVCEFDAETNQYRLLPPPPIEKTYNDPKPSRSSMKKLAKTLINGDYTPPKEDENTRSK